MRKVRVLHVVNSLEPGGMENGVVNLAIGLRSEDIDTRFACLDRPGDFAARLPDECQVTVLGKKNSFSVRATLRLIFEINRFRPDVLHTHNLGPLIYASLASFGGLTVPILHGEHSALAPDDYSPKRLAQRRRLFRYCSAIHTVADSTRHELVEIGTPPEDLHSLPNGVDVSRFAPGNREAARAQLGLPPDAIVVGMVGRFGPFKGHETLLEAFREFPVGDRPVHLLIVGGGGPLEAKIRDQAAAHSAQGRIHLTGYTSDPRAAYQAMDLLAIPSTNEGMSNAALEAMACAVPVLANDDCGHEQIVLDGKTGWLRDIRAPGGLREQLINLCADPAALVDFGQKARTRVTLEFSLERMLARYAQLYRALAVRTR